MLYTEPEPKSTVVWIYQEMISAQRNLLNAALRNNMVHLTAYTGNQIHLPKTCAMVSLFIRIRSELIELQNNEQGCILIAKIVNFFLMNQKSFQAFCLK